LRSGSRLMLFGAIFDAPTKQSRLNELEIELSAPDFWDNPERSQKVMQDRKRLETGIGEAKSIASTTSDIDTLFELAREGEAVVGDIDKEMKALGKRLEDVETGMLLSGENDFRDAIVTIHPGAGGTESQDWAEMLERMYLRWAERHGFKPEITDRLEGGD
jgi:peptide chain release factor 2